MLGFFSRKKNSGERFPVERLRHLTLALAASVEGCARKHQLDSQAVWGSKFIGGYLLGYPTYLDDVDERLAGLVRQMLFDGMFGADYGREAFKKAMEHLLLEDQQTKRGWGAAAPDGERYFRALEEKRDAADSMTSLNAMFEIQSIDISQQFL